MGYTNNNNLAKLDNFESLLYVINLIKILFSGVNKFKKQFTF